MQYFLSTVAEYILEKYGDKTNNICIVTPNRRSGLFFRKHLSKLTKGPIWAPEIISFEDFLTSLTSLNLCDNITLNIEFYKVYKEIAKDNAEQLEDFLKWAPALLNDFNDIDSAITEQDKLFGYLKDLKYIETWNPGGEELTDFQKKYLKFFENISVYYNEISSKLLSKKMAYQGLCIRYAAENINLLQENMPWEKVVFAGFNALSNGEEKIIKTLVKNDLAEVLWDADNYYLKNEDHEAGHFLRKYKTDWKLKDFNFIGDYYKTTTKNIHIAGIPKNVNQAKLAGNILKNLGNAATGDETALVLSNENLLLPALNSMPENIENLNVTMGFPLKKTGLYGYFDAIFRLQINSDKFDKKDGFPRFYHKDIVRILNHIGTRMLCNIHDDYEFSTIADDVVNSNRVLHSVNTLKEISKISPLVNDLSLIIAENWNASPKTAIKHLIDICDKMETSVNATIDENETNNTDKYSGYIDVVDEESIYTLKSVFRKLEIFVNETNLIPNLKTLYILFKSLASESRLSFTGEPLKGLQVLGMLETRNLDFKNIILLSVNEDILPAPSKKVSFIHYDVRKKFGMNVYSDQDALYAYHFYRLLQRAENVFLIYNTQTEGVGSTEKSRFITQIEHELKDYNTNITINDKIVTMPLSKNPGNDKVIIEKSQDIINRLYELNKRGFSPSALSIYISCPLRFYFNNIAGVTESEEVEETIEANTLGSVVHEVLKELYNDFIGRVINTDDIEKMKPKVASVTGKMFKNFYSGGSITSGKNLLYRRMAEKYTNNFLKQEQNKLKKGEILTIISLEEIFRKSLSVKENNKSFNFNFKGTIDRIDSLNGNTRIIDYKTGFVEKKDLKIDEWEDVFTDRKYDKAFQLLMYSYIYQQDNNKTESFIPGIFSLRMYKDGLINITTPEKKDTIDHEALLKVEEYLGKLMLEIFDEKLTFSQTENEDNCIFCPFKIVCNRHVSKSW